MHKRLKLTAYAGDQINRYIFKQISQVSMMNSKGVSYVPFLVKNCTGNPLHLRAEIIGQKQVSKIYFMIPFYTEAL